MPVFQTDWLTTVAVVNPSKVLGKSQLTGLLLPRPKIFMIFLLRAFPGYLEKANKTKKCEVFYAITCYYVS